jgi:alkylhydroperoxidase/carboxymuconolactone decarboxylase family protein YurZ
MVASWRSVARSPTPRASPAPCLRLAYGRLGRDVNVGIRRPARSFDLGDEAGYRRRAIAIRDFRSHKGAGMAQPNLPPWIQTLQQRDPQFVESYMAQRERILRDGAIPAKYKILMTMIVDALLSHPDGVATIANRARGAGASEAEIQEAVEVAYLFGGTPALVTAVNAFRTA